MPTWGHISLQNASSPIMEQLLFFHDHTMLILFIITIFTSYILVTNYK